VRDGVEEFAVFDAPGDVGAQVVDELFAVEFAGVLVGGASQSSRSPWGVSIRT
jgi:hypothetical protein